MKLHSQSARGGVQQWTALLFVLVMAVFGFVQAVHAHDGPTSDLRPNAPVTHCATCVASHSTAVRAEVSFAPVLALQPGTLLLSEPQLQSRLPIFGLYTRPPPPAL